MSKIMLNPATRAYMQQPDFVSMLAEVQRNPAAANKYMNDPRMMQVLGVLLNMNIMTGDAAASFAGNASSVPPPPPPREPELTGALKGRVVESLFVLSCACRRGEGGKGCAGRRAARERAR
jgi:hypothetical protein